MQCSSMAKRTKAQRSAAAKKGVLTRKRNAAAKKGSKKRKKKRQNQFSFYSNFAKSLYKIKKCTCITAK